MSLFGREYRQYLPVSDRDRRWDLYVTGTGHTTVEVIEAGRPEQRQPEGNWYAAEDGRRMPDYAVVYVSRGEGHFESEPTDKRAVSAGTVMLVFPGVWHRYFANKETGWTEYWVTFGGGYADRLVRRGFISPQEPVLDTGTDDGILRPFLRLLDRVRSEPLGLQQLAAADTMEILAAILAADRARQSGVTLRGVVQQATLIFQQHTTEAVDLEKLAASLHLSYNRFRHAFKQQTGMAPYQYHLQLRINRAKELLLGTSFSVKEIAATLGFHDPFHFSKAFKRHTGVSPTQWRGHSAGKTPGR